MTTKLRLKTRGNYILEILESKINGQAAGYVGVSVVYPFLSIHIQLSDTSEQRLVRVTIETVLLSRLIYFTFL